MGRCPILFLGGEQAESLSVVCGVRAELISALQAQRSHGQRALSLLLDAAHVLNRPAEFRAPYEVAQSCLRGALDSVLSIAGEDFPRLRSATRAVAEAAGALRTSSRLVEKERAEAARPYPPRMNPAELLRRQRSEGYARNSTRP